jgi:ribosomal protein S11
MKQFRLTQTAESTPFANTNFASENVADAIPEVRERHEYLQVNGATAYNNVKTTVTTNGTLTLTNQSDALQYLIGNATGFKVKLPNATTEHDGQYYIIANTTNNTVEITDSANTVLFTLAQNSLGFIYLKDKVTAAGVWVYYQILASSVATGIINYNITSSTPFVTSSRFPTFVVITGFTVTPQAGTYVCLYNASVLYTTTPKLHYWNFYREGAVVASSDRQQLTSRANQVMVDSLVEVISFNGSETLDVRVSCDNTGTLTVNDRTLVLIRLGT